MEYTRRHKGVCSRASYVDIDENGVIRSAKIIGGCDGNTRGLAQIVEGLPAKFVIEKWKQKRTHNLQRPYGRFFVCTAKRNVIYCSLNILNSGREK